MERYRIKAWREGADASERLPIACPDEPSARAMFRHVLRKGSEYDHAILYKLSSDGYHFRPLETGHREGSALTRTAAGTVNHALETMVDQLFRNMMDTNSTEPYDHDEYSRWDRMLKAALVLLTNGDEPYADALREAFTDSGEDIRWYLTQQTRNDLCFHFGTMTREEWEATLRFAVECEEGGETWTDAFGTYQEAVDHTAYLVANTRIVDRETTQKS